MLANLKSLTKTARALEDMLEEYEIRILTLQASTEEMVTLKVVDMDVRLERVYVLKCLTITKNDVVSKIDTFNQYLEPLFIECENLELEIK